MWALGDRVGVQGEWAGSCDHWGGLAVWGVSWGTGGHPSDLRATVPALGGLPTLQSCSAVRRARGGLAASGCQEDSARQRRRGSRGICRIKGVQ